MADSEKEKYGKYLCSAEWWAKRNAVMERCNSKCEDCGSPASHVHHLTYVRKYNERLEDLKALCEPCHSKIHSAKPVAAKSRISCTEKECIQDCIQIYVEMAISASMFNEASRIKEVEKRVNELNGKILGDSDQDMEFLRQAFFLTKEKFDLIEKIKKQVIYGK